MAFDDLMERMKKRSKVRVVLGGNVLEEMDHSGPVFKGQAVFLEMLPKNGIAEMAVPPIRERYEVVRVEYEDDTVIAHVQLSTEAA